ncbi:MAG: S9 family peptidase [Rhizobiales bacterium]|nr:S9 family peptidase [Rhizobacter sp.]
MVYARPTTTFARALVRVALTFSTLVAGVAQAADPVPVADFFRRAEFVDMVMSPNGRAVAALGLGKSGRVGLVILDLDDMSKSKNIASFSDTDVARVRWVNDDRLIFSVTDRKLEYGDRLGNGLFAINRDGSDAPRMLIRREWRSISSATNIVDRSLAPDHTLRSVLRDGSADILIERRAYDADYQPLGVTLIRLDTRNGLAVNLSQGDPDHVFAYASDSKGRPRAAVTYWADKATLYWKPAADKPWSLLNSYANALQGGWPSPVWVDSDDRLYLVGNAADGRDTEALIRIDMRDENRTVTPVVSLDGYDFTGALLTDTKNELKGVTYLNDARGTHWFDPRIAQIQKQVDALLPTTGNLLDCGDCDNPTRVLVKSASDRQPTVFQLLDPKAGTLQVLAGSRPWVKPATMAQRDLVRIQARDGLNIPVHVTRPKDQQGPAAMVVLVHGGPWVRGGEWKWDAESQFLASRGYVVIEPEFRGSTGFGDKLYRAGFKQWGLAMQDDIADATQWAVKQGHADPKRVCIAGAEYGGYATLMGLIRYPELYRCGVEWLGVTDIELMYSINWSDASEIWKRYGMPALIGDRVKDAAQLAATSPIKLAGKLTQPLLMAYGGADRRVPIEHGIKMRDALRGHNKQVEWIDYPSEGHGWSLQANDIDFWTRVEKFLARNLKDVP